ncbi:acyl-CoA thioesterase [Streptomyces sp. NPDC004980]
MTSTTSDAIALAIDDKGVRQTVPVHFDDLDSFGMVHHGKYPSLFERALTTYWTGRGISFNRSQSSVADVFQVVKVMELNYELPITSVGEVQVHFWIERMGRTSYTYGFRVLSDTESVVHATGRRVQVNLDPETLRPSPFSQKALDAARPLMAEAASR